MFFLSGASGKTGKAILRALAERGESARAFVHREMPLPGAAEVVVGDLRDEAAVRQAMRGARAVYHICPNVNPEEVVIGKWVIAAAKAAGVERFVFHSVLHPQAEAMPHHWAKLRVEEMLFESGLPFTILQPTAYMQNLLAGWPMIAREGVLRQPYPVETRISLVDLEDVAEAAATVLTESGHADATYELVGTSALSQSEVAEILGAALGRAVRAETESVEAWAARSSALGDYQKETLVKMFRYYAAHGLAGNPNTLRWLLGRAPTTLQEFAARTVAGDDTPRRRKPRYCEG